MFFCIQSDFYSFYNFNAWKKTILQEFSTITTKEQLTETYQKYLGKNGLLSTELKNLATLSLEEKKEKGKKLTDLRQSIEEIFAIAEKEKEYFWKEGGITFSWGNPLVQAGELAEVLKYLKEKKIHTCIDTNGFYLTDEVKTCIKYADFILPDLKQIDSQKHQNLTGTPNEMPLEFIKYIDQEKKNYWIRYVVVPGYTDDEKDLKNSDSFSSDYQIFKESSSSPIIIYEKQNEENSDENILFEIKKRVLLKKFKRLKIFFLIMFKIFW